MQVHCLVKPRSKTDQISVNADGTWKIRIREVPEDGKANEYLVNYLADVLGLAKSRIQIMTGFTSSHKRINIVAEDEVIQTAISKLKT